MKSREGSGSLMALMGAAFMGGALAVAGLAVALKLGQGWLQWW